MNNKFEYVSTNLPKSFLKPKSFFNTFFNKGRLLPFFLKGDYLEIGLIKPTTFSVCLGLLLVVCSSAQSAESTAKASVLSIDIVPALCQLNQRYAKSRQCADGKSYVIRHLNILNNTNKRCHSQSIAHLSPVQAKRVDTLMPDKQAQKQAWQNYGACSGLSASQYFRQIIQKSSQLKLPKELTDEKIHKLTTTQLTNKLITNNQGLTANNIRLRCQRSSTGNLQGQLLLTEIQVCYQQNRFHQCSPNITDEISKNTSCGGKITIVGN